MDVQRIRSSLWWTVAFALLMLVADVLLQPDPLADPPVDVGAGLGLLFYLCVGIVLAMGILASGALAGRAARLVAVLVPLATVIAGTAGGTLYSSDAVPVWRDALLPGLSLLAGALGLLWWFRGDGNLAERLLLVGLIATGMVGYAQQNPQLWALIAGVVVSYAWLVLPVRPFSRHVGLAIHALALLAFIQAVPVWFAWTPFPFLTFYPLYLLGAYHMATGRPRKVAWWIGFVVGLATLLLGMSTFVAALVDSLPVLDSIIMIVGGGTFAAVFASLRFIQANYDKPVPT